MPNETGATRQTMCEAMHLMQQQSQPDDYLVASGESHTVREFCYRAFAELDLDYRDFVMVDKRY